jgi:hypothetical protein
MSARDPFTPGQWAAVVDAAPAIARAVAAAAGKPADPVRELGAFETSLASATSYGNELLGQLIDAVRDRLATGAVVGPPDRAVMDGIEAARKAGAILAALATPDDAAAVRAWLVGLARTVGSAAREGGLLGIGGAQVSDAEEQLILELSEALGSLEHDG